MDLVLNKVFKEWESGTVLPEAESILQSMMRRFIERQPPLALYHKFFLTQHTKIDDNLKFDNDGPGQTMNIAQKIRGKLMPKKQNKQLQVFTREITEDLSSVRIEQLVSTQLAQETLANGIEYEVETFIIDLRKSFLEAKVDWIKN